MKLIRQIRAGRYVDKLKQSRTLPAEELAAALNELVALGPASIELLIECLSHGEARDPAMEGLERLLSPETLGTYVEALSSPNPTVVSAVTKVLEKSKRFDPHRLMDHLVDPRVPKGALDAILSQHSSTLSPVALFDILPQLGKEGRAVIFRLLEKIADKTSVPRLLSLLSNQDWSIRVNAAKLLARFPGEASIEGICGLLHDANKNVRLEAVKALAAAAARQAVPALAQVLRDNDIKVQTAAIDALISIGDASAIPHLLDVLKDESEYCRRAAVEVLNQVATTEAIQDLVRALRDEDWWVRVRAADALGALGGERVVDAVIGLLGDPDDFVRRYAVEILNSVTSRKSVSPLIGALDDADWWVRERSIDALGKTKDPRAVEPLLELMHRDTNVIVLCIGALGEIGDPRALDSLVVLARSERQEVRRAAIEALRSFPAAGLSPEDRKVVNDALARSGAVDDSGTPMLVEGRRGGFGPEAGRAPRSPSYGAPASGGSGTTTPSPRSFSAHPTPASPHSPVRGTAEPRATGAPSPRPEASPSGQAPLNFYELPPDTTLLQRFRVLRTIGKGGFGVVYLVHDQAIQDDLILKVLNPQLSIDDAAIQRFVRELKLTRKITHKNVIRIHDLLDLGGVRAVSMEYFPGRDLGKIIKQEGMMAPRRVLLIIAGVCEGLAAAHAAGVIHRDIKPANILVGTDDEVKIVDFGLASARQQLESRLTKSGLLVGTPEYMAPEQIRGSVIDPRTDLYSVGIVMYELLAGKKPFNGETAVQILFQHLEGKAEALPSLGHDLSPELDALVVRAMAREPDQRYRTAEELLGEIRAVLAITGQPGQPHA